MRKLSKILSTFILTMIFVATIPSVSAVGTTPLKSLLKAAPGETVTGYITVQNTENSPREIVLTKGDFRVREDESMQFLMQKDPDNQWSMQDWISLPENNILLDAGKGKQIKYTVTVPRSAKSQSYYGTIFVSGKIPDTKQSTQSSVGISTNIAHLILLEVTGDLKSDIQLKSFSVDTKQYGDEEKEIRFNTVLFNSGNTHTAPTGIITIKNENDEVIDTITLNDEKFNAIPSRQKTLVEKWDYSNVPAGTYTAYLDGKTPEGQTFAATTTLTVNSNEVTEGESQILHATSQNTNNKDKSILYFLIIATLISATIKSTNILKKKKKSHKKFLGIFSVIIIFGGIGISSVFAQDYHEVDVNLTVELGQISSFELDGCWNDTGGDTWVFDTNDSTATLNQPGDRESNPNSGDQYGWYDTYGGNANGNLAPTDTNSFGYDDCQFKVTAENWSSWNITLYSDDFDDGFGNEVPDMAGYSNANFDYNLESEDPNSGGGTQYPLDDGEHGFFIVHKSSGMVSPATDTGSAGGVSYSSQKTFDATTCGDGNARPCYHFIPGSGSPQTIFSSSSNVTDETFVTRFGMGADFSFPAGDYDMTVTLTLNTTP